ncbi:MAG: hypothetical protein P4N60_01770 [Verrucomicrobiae bacterium]|nr:hypothetical protein [Verrucomicrobiae bacterium]
MKQALLAIIILAIGAAAFCALRSTSTGLRRELVMQQAAWQTQTQQLAQLYLVKQQVIERTSENKRLFAALPPLPALQQLEQKILAGDSLRNLSAAESEQLLAELGFNWNTSGDYLIVSKKSLDGIDYDGMKGVNLTKAALETLAITPEERGVIEAMTKQLNETRSTWVLEHVQRTEPSGNVLAQYSLPVDEAFSQSQMDIYTNGIFNALGQERAQWLEDHSQEWMQAVGLLAGENMSKVPKALLDTLPADAYGPKPTTMKVERYQSGDQWHLNLTLQQGGGTMTTSVNPWQPFPEAFRTLFPGGWQELAEREGFELPPEFNKKK